MVSLVKNIYHQRTILGSPEMLWPLLSQSELWRLWLGDTDQDIALHSSFSLTTTYLPDNKKTIWYGEVTQTKSQIFIEFTLQNSQLKQNTTVRFFIKQNNGNMLLEVTQTGFSGKNFLNTLILIREIRRINAFWIKALNKLEYYIERNFNK